MIEKSENAELLEDLDAVVSDVIDQFVTKGHETKVIIELLTEVVARRRVAYERDPDPAEDDVDEPANDWPGADVRGAL